MTCIGCDTDRPIHARQLCLRCYAKRQRCGLIRSAPKAQRGPCRECGAAYRPRTFAHGRCSTCRTRLWRKTRHVRIYASSYIGVTTMHGRYVAKWREGGMGHLRPRTPQGQRWAAQDRARALGVEYLEKRNGARVPYLWKTYEEMSG